MNKILIYNNLINKDGFNPFSMKQYFAIPVIPIKVALKYDIRPSYNHFERAILIDDSNLTETEKQYLTGFKMIYSHLVNIMEKFDVKPIDGSDKPFDPVYHNAIMLEKKEGVPSGMVIEVLQKGYKLYDRVIRAASVKVNQK